jgi:hypothetical protein
MSFVDDDLDAFFADLSVPVVFGSQTGKGLLDAPGNDLDVRALGPGIAVTDYSLTYKTTAFSPAPKVKDSITVGGISYIIRDIDTLDDGKLSKAMLKTK